MRYQDSFNAGPPWDDADDRFRRSDLHGGDLQRGDLHRGDYRRGTFETSVDAFRPIDPVADEPADGEIPSQGRTSRGLLAGGTAGFLAAALALGVANLAAAFVRPQASPIIAVGEAFIDRTPPALKNFAIQKFGENDKNMLLLGLYVTIALIAIAIGMIAWRHAWAGITGIGLFGAFGAFVAYTRPESHVTDVLPSLAGGIAGIVAIICLTRWPRGRTSGGPQAFTRGWAG
jgi:hypothetical protein